jgi:hypothetical protein
MANDNTQDYWDDTDEGHVDTRLTRTFHEIFSTP